MYVLKTRMHQDRILLDTHVSSNTKAQVYSCNKRCLDILRLGAEWKFGCQFEHKDGSAEMQNTTSEFVLSFFTVSGSSKAHCFMCWTRLGDLSDREVPVNTGAQIHGTLVCTNVSTGKKKREKRKGRWRNKGGRRRNIGGMKKRKQRRRRKNEKQERRGEETTATYLRISGSNEATMTRQRHRTRALF